MAPDNMQQSDDNIQTFGCMYSQNRTPCHREQCLTFEHMQSSMAIQHCEFNKDHLKQEKRTMKNLKQLEGMIPF